MPEKSGTGRARSVRLDPEKVLWEMQRRGWAQRDLAEATQKLDGFGLGISQMAVSRVLQSGRAAARTSRLIALAFAANPPVLDGLLGETA